MPKHRITPFFQLINERFISFIMETVSDNCTFAFFGFLVSRKEDFGFSTDAYPELTHTIGTVYLASPTIPRVINSLLYALFTKVLCFSSDYDYRFANLEKQKNALVANNFPLNICLKSIVWPRPTLTRLGIIIPDVQDSTERIIFPGFWNFFDFTNEIMNFYIFFI